MPKRPLALAIGRVHEPHRRRSGIGPRPIVANVDPQPARLGLAVPRREHRDRNVVGVDLEGGLDVLADRISLAVRMCARSPAPAMLRSIGRLGAGACRICEQPEQENFGRTYRMTLNCSGTRSRISLTSSPRYRSLPPQLGQGLSAGTWGCDTVSRGRLLGKGLRTGLPFTGYGGPASPSRYSFGWRCPLRFYGDT